MPSCPSWMILSFLSYSSNYAATPSQECGVYLAKSTIPNAGLGMFAGRTYRHGDQVLDGDLLVPLEEIDWNNGNTDDWEFVWEDYAWSSLRFPFADEETDSPRDLTMASFGMGAAMNSLLHLVNVEDGHTSNNYADRYTSGMELTDDPDATFWLNTDFPYYPPSMEIWVHEMAGVSISGREDVDFHLVRIVGRYKDKDGKDLYNAEVIQRIRSSQQNISSEISLGVAFGLPSDAFYFEDARYTREHQLQFAFRRPMMIPDDMMPTAWMNVS